MVINGPNSYKWTVIVKTSLKKQLCAFLAATFLISAAPVRADFPWQNTFLGIAALYVASVAYTCAKYTLPRGHDAQYWDWNKKDKKIDTDAQVLAKKLSKTHNGQEFLWGVATSAHQVEGDCHNNWSEGEKARLGKKDPKTQEILMQALSDKACEHWKRYKEDIQLIKKLGVNSYRFSVEWSKIQPNRKSFDEKALKHYEDVCDELIANGIKPVVTLHHYTNPVWFEELGAFEKEENCTYFVAFCESVFDRLKDKVHLWITFNSPSGYALQGYLRGKYPPFVEGDMQRATEVTKNMLETHVRVYKKLKKVKPDAQIGILHQHAPLKPYSVFQPWDNIGCEIGHDLNNASTLEFFKSGTFSVKVPFKKIPFKCDVEHTNPDAPKSLDFFGLSYYSHQRLNNFGTKHHAEDRIAGKEIATDKSSFVIYPEGMYHSIKEVAKYIGEIPIYITENGTADDERAESHLTVDGTKMTRREFFLRRYLAAIAQAKEEGYDVRGYMHWALMDNFEWNEGYSKKFGLYKVDFDTQERTLREGAKYYQNLVRAAQNLGDVQAVVKESKTSGVVGLQPVI